MHFVVWSMLQILKVVLNDLIIFAVHKNLLFITRVHGHLLESSHALVTNRDPARPFENVNLLKMLTR